jgi:hypothetical protein
VRPHGAAASWAKVMKTTWMGVMRRDSRVTT